MMSLPITEITKLRVGPLDAVVVTASKPMSEAAMTRLRDRVEQALPGTRVVVVEREVSVEVVPFALPDLPAEDPAPDDNDAEPKLPTRRKVDAP